MLPTPSRKTSWRKKFASVSGVRLKRQMISDVPIGAFLSAGLDSSSIVAMMAQASRQPVRTYTITFPDKYRVGENALDDPEVATRLARRLGCENQRIVVEPDVADLLPRLAWHMDEPTADPAIIPAYLVCREARKQATVLLSGVGGDELFAGYRKHSAHYWAEAYQHVPAAARGLIAGTVARSSQLPRHSGEGKRAPGEENDAQRLALAGGTLHDELHLPGRRAEDFALRASIRARRFSAPILPLGIALALQQVEGSDFLNQMLYLDTKIFMASLNLNYNDKMSMASSVEVRVPFLDRELAEFVAWNVPPSLKLKGFFRPTTKYIFRKAMKDVLPREVLSQPKAGFAAPIDYWLAHDLKEMTDDLLSESRIRQRGLFRPEAVRGFVEQHRRGTQDWSMQIWQFLTLELWMQTFLDGSAAAMTDLAGRAIA